MKKALQIVLIVFTATYVFCPIDAVVGPFDDIIVALMGIVTARSLASKTRR